MGKTGEGEGRKRERGGRCGARHRQVLARDNNDLGGGINRICLCDIFWLSHSVSTQIEVNEADQ